MILECKAGLDTLWSTHSGYIEYGKISPWRQVKSIHPWVRGEEILNKLDLSYSASGLLYIISKPQRPPGWLDH